MASQMLEVRLADWVCKNIYSGLLQPNRMKFIKEPKFIELQLQIIDIDTDKVENK